MMRKHIAVIGNMGAGKTTFINLLIPHFAYPPVVFLEQPSDYPFVELSFREPHRWSMTNQIQFLLVKLQQQMNPGNRILIQEMDLHAAHYLWTPVLHDLGHVTNIEGELIQQIFEMYDRAISFSKPDIYVYIKADPDIVLRQISKRSRDYESIDDSLVQLVNLVHKNMEKFISSLNTEVITIENENVDLTIESPLRDQFMRNIYQQLR